ncbi:MAG TPA: ABC transporter permease [Candidatus Limnocylindria bacterium]|nr:ABC transporter permease [Candidatus Limnocylindria bacterium]
MLRYVVRRTANIVIVLIGMTVFVFLLLHLAPGSPVYRLVGEQTTPEEIVELERKFGLDQPLHVQYLRFVSGALQGDLGTSVIYSTSASDLLIERLPATLELTLAATVLTLIVAIPTGIIISVRRKTWVDYAGTLFTIAGVSVPSFWLGLMLILIFSVDLGWFAVSGKGPPLVDAIVDAVYLDFGTLGKALRHLVLPTITLSAFQLAFLSRLTRSSILEELGQNYVRAARARGLPRFLVITKHALRNALLPVLTVFGLELGSLIGGAVITEGVFAWPGVGQLIFQAVSGRDYPLAQAGILIIGTFVVLLTFLVDLAYGFVDPRIRYATR